MLDFSNVSIGRCVFFSDICKEVFDRDSLKDTLMKANYEAYYTLKAKECEAVRLSLVVLDDGSEHIIPYIIVVSNGKDYEDKVYGYHPYSKLDDKRIKGIKTTVIVKQNEILKYPTIYKLNKREYKKLYTEYKNRTSVVVYSLDVKHRVKGSIFMVSLAIEGKVYTNRLVIDIGGSLKVGSYQHTITYNDFTVDMVVYRMLVK